MTDLPAASERSFSVAWRWPVVIAIAVAAMMAALGAVKIVRLSDTPRYLQLADNLLEHGAYSSCQAPPLKPELERKGQLGCKRLDLPSLLQREAFRVAR